MVTDMEQISIWDILDETESESDEWNYLHHTDYIEWISENTMPLIQTVTERHIMKHPDVICEGTVNGKPAYIGFKAWVSGFNECFLEYEAIQYKLKEE